MHFVFRRYRLGLAAIALVGTAYTLLTARLVGRFMQNRRGSAPTARP